MKMTLAILAVAISVGCAVNDGKSLIISTESVVGIKLGVDKYKIPELKIGYARAETSIAPVSKEKELYTVPILAKLGVKTFAPNAGIWSLMATGGAAIENKGMVQDIDEGIDAPTPGASPTPTPGGEKP